MSCFFWFSFFSPHSDIIKGCSLDKKDPKKSFMIDELFYSVYKTQLNTLYPGSITL